MNIQAETHQERLRKVLRKHLEESPSVCVQMNWNEEIIPGKESITRKMKNGLFFAESPLEQSSKRQC